MKNEAFVLVFDGLADWEPAYALCALTRSGRFSVTTVGFTRDPVTTLGGLRVLPDITLDQVDPAGSAIFILPGGDRWESISAGAAPDSDVHELLRQLHAQGSVIAAICGATLAVARAGLTHGRKHTGNALEHLTMSVPGYRDAGSYVTDRAVTDGNLITAGVTGSLEFAREVMQRLELESPAGIEAWYAAFTGSSEGATTA